MPEDWKPHILHIEKESITASGSATDTITVGANEHIEVHQIYFIKATGDFDLEIKDQSGYAYQNEQFTISLNNNSSDKIDLPVPLNMYPSSTWTFKIYDTSAATNDVYILLIGKKKIIT